MKARDQAYQTLASLNPSPVFLEAHRTTHLPENLDLMAFLTGGPSQSIEDDYHRKDRFIKAIGS